jgi:hypothetical protein
MDVNTPIRMKVRVKITAQCVMSMLPIDNAELFLSARDDL